MNALQQAALKALQALIGEYQAELASEESLEAIIALYEALSDDGVDVTAYRQAYEDAREDSAA